ncbi:MAG: cation:proton antiporter [Sarcina sp.]
MQDTLNYNSLLTISIIAFITPFLVSNLKKIKIPYQVGEILIGILFGKTFFNIINANTTITLLANLGLAYLMFLSGLEIDMKNLLSKKADKSHIYISITMQIISIILALILSFIASRFIGIAKGTILFTMIFTASSPGLIVPLFKSKNLLKTKFGQIILSFGIICEFTSIIGLTIIFSISQNGLSLKSFKFILVFVSALILYYIVKLFMKKYKFKVSAKNLHIVVRAAFALILILVVIAEQFDTEIVLGSFLAGIIFSLLLGKAKEEVSHQLDIIGYGFLVPIFFIMVGANVDLRIVLSEPIILAKVSILILIFLAVKLIPSILLVKKFGIRKSLSAAFILSAQLSLVIVAAQMALDFKYIGIQDYYAFILATIISCVIFPILFEKLCSTSDSVRSSNKELIIREVVLTNNFFTNKPLKICEFQSSCRIFSITRNDEEFLPTANTTLSLGDQLILVGERDSVSNMLEILSNN